MTRVEPVERQPGALRRGLGRMAGWLMRRCWFTSGPVVLMLKATPSQCVEKLRAAARPNARRLDLGNLYVNGRRYFVQARPGGFRLTTTSKIPWRARERTASATIMQGDFAPFGEEATRIHIRVRVSPVYTLTALALPLFMTSILIYVPWPPLVIGLALGLLFALAWGIHRLSAALEANDMIWFVQKALEDFVPAEVMSLNAETPLHYDEHEFARAWERFYESRR